MRSLVVPVILLAASAAFAQPEKQKQMPVQPAKPMPPKAPAKAPCAPLDGPSPRWVIANGSVTACFAADEGSPESCFAFSPTAAPKPVAAPPKAAPPKNDAEVKDDGGKLSVCVVGTPCKPLGKKLVAAIAKLAASQKAEGGTVSSPSATSDGKVVVTGGDAWVVAGDKKLAPKKPKEYGKGEDKPDLGAIEVAGNAIIANWSNCAGPCGLSILIDAKGANRGKAFGSGVNLPLDAKRLAVFSIESANELVVIDLASGKQTSRVPLEMGGVTPASAAKIDDTNVVVAWQRENDWKLQFIATPMDKPATGGASHTIAACAR